MIPIWYLDVDGVINIVSPIRPHDVPEEHWRDIKLPVTRRKSSFELPIRYDQRVVDFVNRMHDEGLIEVVWLTTWETDAPKDLAPGLELRDFRLPARSLRDFPEGASGWWKWESIKMHAADDDHDHRTIIWTDDDLNYAMKMNPEIQAWSESREARGLSTLGITPYRHRGLSMEHLAEIEKLTQIRGAS